MRGEGGAHVSANALLLLLPLVCKDGPLWDGVVAPSGVVWAMINECSLSRVCVCVCEGTLVCTCHPPRTAIGTTIWTAVRGEGSLLPSGVYTHSAKIHTASGVVWWWHYSEGTLKG